MRLLRHLFGDEPPPRPHPHSHPRWHLGHRHRHEDHDDRVEELRRQGEEQVGDAADDASPPQPHGH